MKTGSTVAELGVGVDGEIGLIRVGTYPDQAEVSLVYNLGAGRWVGQPQLALAQRDMTSMSYAATSTLTDWGYIFQQGDSGDIRTSMGTTIHNIDQVGLLYAAGLRLQEHLSGYVYGADGTSVPQITAWWYQFNASGVTNFFAYTNPFSGAGQGITLTGTATRSWRTTGWVDSPHGAFGKRFAYPDFYGKMLSGTVGQGKIENVNLHYRWVGNPVTAAVSQPPVTAGLKVWADASQETLNNGDLVQVWSDRSGHGNNLHALNNSTRKPTFVTAAVNTRPVIRFNGTTNILRTYFDNAVYEQPNTFFLVLKQFSGGATQQVWFDSAPSTYDVAVKRNLAYRYDATNQISVFAGGTDRIYTRATNWPSAYVIFTFEFSGVTTRIWENNTLVYTVPGTPGAEGASGLTLGSTYTDILFGNIDIAEVLFYNAALSSGDRGNVVTWLNTKYNLF